VAEMLICYALVMAGAIAQLALLPGKEVFSKYYGKTYDGDREEIMIWTQERIR